MPDLVQQGALLRPQEQQRKKQRRGDARHLCASLLQSPWLRLPKLRRSGPWHNVFNMSTKPHRGDHPKDGAKCAPKVRPARGKPPVWRQDDGAPVSCLEKIKVLNENYAELQQTAQDALEDALLIGCSEAQVRGALHELIDDLVNPYAGIAAEAPEKPLKD